MLPAEGANNQSIWRRLFNYGLVLVWMGVIYYATSADFSADNTSRIIWPFFRWLFPSTSSESFALVHIITRKCAHFAAYAILAFLGARAFRSSSTGLLRSRWFAAALLLVICYAFLDEFHQSFVPSRTASIYDSMIDIAGGMSFLLINRWFVGGQRRHVRKIG